MARVAGVDLPPNKRAEIGLTYIYGIGRSRSNSVLKEAGVNLDTRVRDLSEDELSRIRAILETQGEIEGDLRKRVQMDIKRLMDIGCYRGLRHRRAARARSTHSYKCSHAQRSATCHHCEEEGAREEIERWTLGFGFWPLLNHKT
jgi:small subunit ribosomal protein S13